MRARYTDGVRCKMLNSANFLPVIQCMKPIPLRGTVGYFMGVAIIRTTTAAMAWQAWMK